MKSLLKLISCFLILNTHTPALASDCRWISTFFYRTANHTSTELFSQSAQAAEKAALTKTITRTENVFALGPISNISPHDINAYNQAFIEFEFPIIPNDVFDANILVANAFNEVGPLDNIHPIDHLQKIMEYINHSWAQQLRLKKLPFESMTDNIIYYLLSDERIEKMIFLDLRSSALPLFSQLKSLGNHKIAEHTATIAKAMDDYQFDGDMEKMLSSIKSANHDIAALNELQETFHQASMEVKHIEIKTSVKHLNHSIKALHNLTGKMDDLLDFINREIPN